MKECTPEQIEKLYDVAKEAQKKSYSPYSGFPVGSSVQFGNDKVFGGCNTENSAYTGTICAERCAISAAFAKLGHEGIRKNPLKAVGVVSNAPGPIAPCGPCRQNIRELGKNIWICCFPNTGTKEKDLETAKIHTLDYLLPMSFGPGDLGKDEFGEDEEEEEGDSDEKPSKSVRRVVK